MTDTLQQPSPTERSTVAPVPEGYTSLTPFLCVADGNAAIDFYTAAFGATVVSRMDTPDGGVAHAELDFGSGRLQLGDASEDYGLVAPDPAGAPVSHSLGIYLADVDAVTAKAAELGATVREQPTTFVTGDRFASVVDPFGHRWSIMTKVEDVSPAEQERRLAEWAKTQQG